MATIKNKERYLYLKNNTQVMTMVREFSGKISNEEIAAALSRQGVHVLPAEIKELAWRNTNMKKSLEPPMKYKKKRISAVPKVHPEEVYELDGLRFLEGE